MLAWERSSGIAAYKSSALDHSSPGPRQSLRPAAEIHSCFTFEWKHNKTWLIFNETLHLTLLASAPLRGLRALSWAQRNWLSTPTHVSLLVCKQRKADFPVAQPGTTTLAPGEACRRIAEACSRTNDTWCYFTDLNIMPIMLRSV